MPNRQPRSSAKAVHLVSSRIPRARPSACRARPALPKRTLAEVAVWLVWQGCMPHTGTPQFVKHAPRVSTSPSKGRLAACPAQQERSSHSMGKKRAVAVRWANTGPNCKASNYLRQSASPARLDFTKTLRGRYLVCRAHRAPSSHLCWLAFASHVGTAPTRIKPP